MFNEWVLPIFHIALGTTLIIVYTVKKKKYISNKTAEKIMIYDVSSYAVYTAILTLGISRLLVNFITTDNPLILAFAPVMIVSGIVGLVFYIKRRKDLDELAGKRFYDFLAFGLLGGLAAAGLVLIVLEFI